jgi:hypothetical protein
MASIIIISPIVIQLVACLSMSNETASLNKLNGIPTTLLQNRTLDINDYGTQRLVYSTHGPANHSGQIKDLLKIFYDRQSKANVNLIVVDNSSVEQYVFEARKENLRNLYSDFYAAVQLNTSLADQLGVSLFYNTMAYHSSATVLNEVTNLLLAFYNNKSLSKSIKTYNSPIRHIEPIKTFYNLLSCYDILPISVFNLIASLNVAFIISMMILHVSTDKIESSKTLAYISGMHYLTYWLANYIFDFMICLFNVASIVLAVYIYDNVTGSAASSSVHEYPTLVHFLVLLYGSSLAWPCFAHVWSFVFKHEVMPFVVVFSLLSLMSLVDVLLAFLQLYGRLNMAFNGSVITLIDYSRLFLMILCPNVTVKHFASALKIREDTFCLNSINYIFKSDSFSLVIRSKPALPFIFNLRKPH